MDMCLNTHQRAHMCALTENAGYDMYQMCMKLPLFGRRVSDTSDNPTTNPQELYLTTHWHLCYIKYAEYGIRIPLTLASGTAWMS